MPKFQSAAELEKFRAEILAKRDPAKPCIAVCAGAACDGLDSAAVAAAFVAAIATLGDKIEVKTTGCHGYCEKGPNVVVTPGDICYFEVSPADVPEIITATLKGEVVERLVYHDPTTGAKAVHMQEVPFYKHQTRLLIGDNPKMDPMTKSCQPRSRKGLPSNWPPLRKSTSSKKAIASAASCSS